ncbi:transposase, partial [Candidatus Poribacteria bacterium]|nr:transposase [Candidatus Poribacteria bacterium]
KIERQREDFHWKLAHQLTDAYDEIRLEALNLQGMKPLWGRKVSDLAFADFVKKLVNVASKKGVKIRFIEKWYPSSKTCSACGTVKESLNLRDRTWQCRDCGTTHDRDR